MVVVSPVFVGARAKIEKEKREHARQHGMIRTEFSGGEIAEDMEKERRLFQLQMCEVNSVTRQEVRCVMTGPPLRTNQLLRSALLPVPAQGQRDQGQEGSRLPAEPHQVLSRPVQVGACPSRTSPPFDL